MSVEECLGRRDDLLDLARTVGERDEAGLELRRGEVHAAVERGAEERPEALEVALAGALVVGHGPRA